MSLSSVHSINKPEPKGSVMPNNSIKSLSPTIFLIVGDTTTRNEVQSILENYWNVVDFNKEDLLLPVIQVLPHLIVSDVSGLSLVQKLKHSEPSLKSIPILLLVASKEEDFNMEEVDDFFVTTSLRAKELVDRVKVNLKLGQLRSKLRVQIEKGITDMDELNKDLKDQIKQKIFAVKALDESEQRRNIMTEFAPVGIGYLNQSGKYVYTNKAMQDCYGMEESELLEHFWYDFIDISSKHQAIHQWNMFQKEQREGNNRCFLKVCYCIVLPNENQKWIYTQIKPCHLNYSDTDYAYIATHTDITEQKRLEEHNIKMLAEAEEQQRIRAQEAETNRRNKDKFIDTVCHEIRNPLNGIQGNTEILHLKLKKLEHLLQQENTTEVVQYLKENLDEMKSSIESIKECTSHQTIITNDVLNLSKIESGNVALNESECHVNPLLEGIVSIFASQLSAKNLRISYQLDQNDLFLVDEHKLKQIVINLLLNAIKFSWPNGEIIIRKEYLAPKQVLQISIQDFGVGMDAEEQAKIFHSFQQANHSIGKKYGGIGLGLVICSQLVGLMNGTIKVNSSKNEGATFTFTVRCKKVEMKHPKEWNQAKQQQQFSKESAQHTVEQHMDRLPILVVEDNEINQKVICRFLQHKGYKFEVANNGREAVDKFQVGKYSLIFMDIVMPEMNGYEAAKLIREKEKQYGAEKVSIVCLSGNSREAHVIQATQAGMDDYATKPIKSEVVYKLVEKWAK